MANLNSDNISMTDLEWLTQFKKTPEYQLLAEKPIAYFSAEYALLPTLPTYAGGLGVLAGDYVRESNEQGVPILFMGLYYQRAQNSLTQSDGHSGNFSPSAIGLTLVVDEKNERIVIAVPLHDRMVYAQAWMWTSGTVRVYLLDTDIPENKTEDRIISERLYTEDRETRLKQELLLGVGGFRLLAKRGYHPSVFHLNEGHSAFLALELVHHEMEHQKVDFDTACEYAKKHILFTNHTLVAAGQEQFTVSLASAMLQKYAEEIGVPVASIVALGTVEDSTLFSMTTFSFKFSAKANAVSAFHAEQAKSVWPTYHMESITNGIFLPLWDACAQSTAETLWQIHQQNKKELLDYIAQTTGEHWDQNTLLIGWARRVVPYKRPMLFLENIERVLAIANHEQRPVRIVFAGPTNNEHPDENQLLNELRTCIQEKLKGVAVFLPNYSITLGKLLTAGTDVWLNTPVIGSEACGTSGMKALLNGSLPLSTRDGWVHEADMSKIGWILDEGDVATKLHDLVSQEIAPLYYEHIAHPEHSAWIERMILGRALIVNSYSMTRALKEYIEKMYIPILHNKHEHQK